MKNPLKFFVMMLVCVVAVFLVSCETVRSDVEVSANTLNFTSSGGAQTITVTGVDWTATSGDKWISVSPSEGSIKVEVGATVQERSGRISVKNAFDEKTITVNQSALDFVFDVTPASLAFEGKNAAPQSVAVTAVNVDWEVEVPSGVGWLHFTKNDNGIEVAVDDNPEKSGRDSKLTVTFSMKGVSKGEKVVAVKQGSGNFQLEADPTSLTFEGKNAAPQPVTVTAVNVDWEVEVPSGINWLHFTRNDKGLEVAVDDNPEKSRRDAKLTITSGLANVPNVEIAVSQSAKPVVAHDFRSETSFSRYLEMVEPNLFDMWLYTVETNEWGSYIGDGYILYLYFYAPTPANVVRPDIKPGTYILGDNKDPYTAVIGKITDTGLRTGSLVSMFKDGKHYETVCIVGGSYSVEREGGNYVMDFDLQLSDETTLTVGYNAPLNVFNPNYSTTLDDDVSFETITGGGIDDFQGDAFYNGTHYHKVVLWSSGLKFAGDDSNGNYLFSGTGDKLLIDFCTVKQAKDILPAGKYTINKATTYDAGTVIPGGITGAQLYNSWYVGMVGGKHKKYGPLTKGEITVSYDGATGIYTIEVDACDDAGYKIKGSYVGTMEFNRKAWD